MSQSKRSAPDHNTSAQSHPKNAPDNQAADESGFDQSFFVAPQDDLPQAAVPLLLKPKNLIGLQATIGNQAVQRLLAKQPLQMTKTGQTKQVQRKLVDWEHDQPTGSKRVIEDHQRHWQQLRRVVSAAQNIQQPQNENEQRLKNSARTFLLIDDADVHAASPLFPSDKRSQKNLKLDTPLKAYKPNLYHIEEDNLENLEELAAAGKAIGQHIWIGFDNPQTDDQIRSTLMHEVQHMMDFHDVLEPAGKFDNAWNVYSTEFRAHSLQGDFDYKGAQPGKQVTGQSISPQGDDHDTKLYKWDEQQFVLFKYLYDAKEYGVVKQAWDAERKLLAKDRTFQKQVVNLKTQNSINPANSPELHRFFELFLGTTKQYYEPKETFYNCFEALGKNDVEHFMRVLANSEQSVVKSRLKNYLEVKTTLTIDDFLGGVDMLLMEADDAYWAKKAQLSEQQFRQREAKQQNEEAVKRKEEEEEEKRQEEAENKKREAEFLKQEEKRLAQEKEAQQRAAAFGAFTQEQAAESEARRKAKEQWERDRIATQKEQEQWEAARRKQAAERQARKKQETPESVGGLRIEGGQDKEREEKRRIEQEKQRAEEEKQQREKRRIEQEKQRAEEEKQQKEKQIIEAHERRQREATRQNPGDTEEELRYQAKRKAIEEENQRRLERLRLEEEERQKRAEERRKARESRLQKPADPS